MRAVVVRGAIQAVVAELFALWRLALPLALAQAGQALMGLVDTAVLGRLSSTAQASAGLGSSLTFLVLFFGIGLLSGLDPLISQSVGARRLTHARTLYWTGVWLALATAVVSLIPLLKVDIVFRAVGVQSPIAEGALTYIEWRLPGVFGQLLFVSARSYLQSIGRARPIFWAMVLANVLNLVLDLVLVFGAGPIPAMGIVGASIATSVCSWAQCGVLVLALGKSPDGAQRGIDWRALSSALRIGLPIGAHYVAEGGIFGLAGLLAGRFGAQSSAAHQVALTWASLTFCVAVGIGSAGGVRVGWAVGGNQPEVARRSGQVALASGAAFMFLTALLFVLFPKPLASLMANDAAVVSMAGSLFVVTAVFQVSDGIQGVGAGVLRGYADTQFVFVANLMGHWVIGLPLAWWFGVRGDLGVVGLWWGLSAGLGTVALAIFVRFHWLSRRPLRTVVIH